MPEMNDLQQETIADTAKSMSAEERMTHVKAMFERVLNSGMDVEGLCLFVCYEDQKNVTLEWLGPPAMCVHMAQIAYTRIGEVVATQAKAPPKILLQ